MVSRTMRYVTAKMYRCVIGWFGEGTHGAYEVTFFKRCVPDKT